MKNLTITDEQIKQIAEDLDCGMVVYFHTETKEIESHPDFDNNEYADQSFFRDVMRKIEKDIDKYLEFEPLQPYESFKIMELFIDEVKDEDVQNKLFNSIKRKKPFRNFREVLNGYPQLLEEWYAFKSDYYKNQVKDIIEAYNNRYEE